MIQCSKVILIGIAMVLMAGHIKPDAYAKGNDPGKPSLPEVSDTKGNIVLALPSGRKVRLSSSGRDCCPVPSPDGTKVAFIRATPDRLLEDVFGKMVEAKEIWMVDVATKQAKLLVKGGDRSEDRYDLMNPSELDFSLDGKTLYFLVDLWPTSAGKLKVDLESGKINLFTDTIYGWIVDSGPYKNCHVAQQHRYFAAGGSYNWFWLIDPNGKAIAPLGPEEDFNLFEQRLSRSTPGLPDHPCE